MVWASIAVQWRGVQAHSKGVPLHPAVFHSACRVPEERGEAGFVLYFLLSDSVEHWCRQDWGYPSFHTSLLGSEGRIVLVVAITRCRKRRTCCFNSQEDEEKVLVSEKKKKKIIRKGFPYQFLGYGPFIFGLCSFHFCLGKISSFHLEDSSRFDSGAWGL